MESVRIDRWLTAARIYASRTQATEACRLGQVSRDAVALTPSHHVAVGDEITARAPRGLVVLLVQKLEEKRLSPPLARELYEDRSPPPPPREELYPQRGRGAGRPTRRERKQLIHRFRDEG